MNKSVKITYISPEPKREGHASFTHVQEIVNGLAALGWDINLFCPHDTCRDLPGALNRLYTIGNMLWRAWRAPRPHLYYLRWHFAVFPIALYARLRGIPTVIEVNGQLVDLFIAWPATRHFRRIFAPIMRLQLRWAGGVIAVTDGLAMMCREMTDDRKLIVTIPNGANIDHFFPKAAQMDNDATAKLPDRFMVFFGTMAPWQGIGTILAAAEDPHWPDGVHLVFAGDGRERTAVELAAARLSHIHYVGRVPYSDLPAVTARAMGAFVCSEDVSDRGATGLAPLKLFESLASGIPVIVTDMPFQADVVHDGNCGYVVPQRDSACLAQTVAKLATDKVQAQTMGENARLIAVEEHSWKARARATHETLLKVL